MRVSQVSSALLMKDTALGTTPKEGSGARGVGLVIGKLEFSVPPLTSREEERGQRLNLPPRAP